MAKQIINLASTTELEAINAMLNSIGEAPITQATLDAGLQADVAVALNILRNTAREIQSMGWRFNTEFGLQVAPSDAYNYTDSAGITTRLGVFPPPAGLAAFEMTQSSDQQGTKYTDCTLRPSKAYAPVVSDSLLDVAGTALSAHVDAVGNAWTRVDVSGQPLLIQASGVDTGTAYATDFYSIYKYGQVLSSPNQIVTALFTLQGISQANVATLRLVTNAGGTSGWEVSIANNGNVYLREFTSLGIKLDVVNGTITGSRNSLYGGGVWSAPVLATLTLTTTTVTVVFSGIGAPVTLTMPRTLPAAPIALQLASLGEVRGGDSCDIFVKSLTVLAPPANPYNVFYDRARNRDGWPLTERQYLYIDAVWLFNFESLPEVCRRYIVIMASRRMAQSVLGSAELASFDDKDQLLALRNLKREEGESDDNNIFDNADVSNIFGGRLPGTPGVFDIRNTPGPVVPVIT